MRYDPEDEAEVESARPARDDHDTSILLVPGRRRRWHWLPGPLVDSIQNQWACGGRAG
jgi:hypothetical protein